MQIATGNLANDPMMTGSTTSSEAVIALLHKLTLSTDTKRHVIGILEREVEREDARVKMAEQYRLKKDLDLFATYQEDWDGEGGHPLTQQVIENFESLLPLISAKTLQQIDIYPENNGSLLVMSRKQEAGVNIGNTAFSYYSTRDNHVFGESHIAFSVDEALRRIEEISL